MKFSLLGCEPSYMRIAIAVASVALALAGLAVTADYGTKSHSEKVNSPVERSLQTDGVQILIPPDDGVLSAAADMAVSLALPGASTREADLAILVAALRNDANTLRVRRQAVWNIAKLGSAEALAVLRAALINVPLQLQATIAEALGKIDSFESREILRRLLDSPEVALVRGAMRGWAHLGGDEAVQVLGRALADSQRGVDVRGEAALSLSRVKNTRAYELLVAGFHKADDNEIAAAILAGLGQRPYAETEAFFRLFLSQPDISTEMRVAAVEALAHAEGDPSSLLLQSLGSDSSEIRAAAAWALSMLEYPTALTPQLLKRLEGERNGDVRVRLYQALEHQSNVDAEKLFVLVTDDGLVSSRVAGFKLLANQIARSHNHALAAQFDAVAVSQLENLAIQSPESQTRMLSVLALKQARTSAAQQALHRITAQSADPRVVAAAKTR